MPVCAWELVFSWKAEGFGLSVCIVHATPQGMFSVAGDPHIVMLFHKLVHKINRTRVGAWQSDQDGRLSRTVLYKLPMRGPAWVRRLCGKAHLY